MQHKKYVVYEYTVGWSCLNQQALCSWMVSGDVEVNRVENESTQKSEFALYGYVDYERNV